MDRQQVLGVLLLVLALGFPSYALACWQWPYTRHRRCGGTGRVGSPSGRFHRDCRGCQGGRKLRFGRRVTRFFVRTQQRPGGRWAD